MYRRTSNSQRAIVASLTVLGAIASLLLPWHVTTNLYMAIAAGSILLAAVLYGTRSRWRDTLAGRTQLYLLGSFGVLATWVSVGLFTGPWPGREEVRDWLFLALALAAINSVVTIWVVQRRTARMEWPGHEDELR